MRVGVIGAEMEGQSTGVGRYLTGLLDGVARVEQDWRWRVFLKGEPADHRLWDHPRIEPVFSGFRGSTVVWEQLVLPRRMRKHPVDVVFSPAYSLPPALTVPSVVTIHDLSFEVLPAEFGWRQRWRRRLLARRAARNASRVLVDTHHIARQMQQLYGVDAKRIGIVPVAVDAAFSSAAADREVEEAALRALGIESPYLLFLGTLLERRSPLLMLEVLRSLLVDRPQLVLVLAGANRMRSPAQLDRWIRELDLDDRVVRLGYVEEGSLPILYRRAELSFFLSSYEGFGIPPLESLACGTPSVVGGGLALDELWPDYPFRCSVLRHSEVLEVTRQALADGPGRDRVLSMAPEVLRKVAWKRVSQGFVSELRKAVAA